MTYATYPSLVDKGVFITGGTSGIGADIVEKFCLQGAKVLFVGRNQEKAAEVIAACKGKATHDPLYVPCDVSNIPQLKSVCAQAIDQLGYISVVINNAANDYRQVTLDVSQEEWDRLMAVNIDHQFFSSQCFLEHMRQHGGGSIINLGSNCYLLSEMATYVTYATAKSAVIGLTRALATEFGRYDIRVNCVLPGWVMTDKQIEQWLTPETEARLLEEQAMKKKLYPEDISRTILFLASDDAKMITKANFIIDGGRV